LFRADGAGSREAQSHEFRGKRGYPPPRV